MYERFLLIKKLLSPTGNLFVHLDWHASHYVKILLDEIFGYDNFRNEIVWCYTGPSRTTTDFPRKHDIILRYSKTGNPRFYPIRVPYKSGVHDTRGTALNYSGRKVDVDLISRKGKIIEDWWTDIWATERYRREYLYFDTQKPLKLLERIIKSSTKTNDLVGDFFAGSGTTIIAAEKLQRKWIGCDASTISYVFTTKRINHLKEDSNLNIAFKTFINKKIKDKLFFLNFSEQIKNAGKNKHTPAIKFSIQRSSNNIIEIDLKDYRISSSENMGEKNKIENIEHKQLIEYIKIGSRLNNSFYFYEFFKKGNKDNIYRVKIEPKSIQSSNNDFYLEIGDFVGNIVFISLKGFTEKKRSDFRRQIV